MLHYYLRRDYDRASSMYERAARLAAAALERADLPEDERAVIAIALRDARDNREKLAALLPAGRGPGGPARPGPR
jgi:hypothetical protein